MQTLNQAVIAFWEKICYLKSRFDTQQFDLEQYNTYLLLRDAIPQVSQVIDFLIEFTTTKNVNQLLNDTNIPMSPIVASIDNQVDVNLQTKLHLLTAN